MLNHSSSMWIDRGCASACSSHASPVATVSRRTSASLVSPARCSSHASLVAPVSRYMSARAGPASCGPSSHCQGAPKGVSSGTSVGRWGAEVAGVPPTRWLQSRGSVSVQAVTAYGEEVHTEDLEESAHVLATALSISQQRTLKMLSYCPSLASMPPMEIIRHTTELSGALLTTREKVLEILSRKPSLLQLSSNQVADRFLDISVALGMPLSDSVPLIVRQPALLDAPPDSLAAQVERLKSVLDMPAEGVATVLSRLRLSHLRSVLLASSQALRGQLNDVHTVLVSKLGSTCPPVSLFTIRNPSLLIVPPKALAASIDRLAVIFAVPPRKLLAICQARCHLLTIPAQQLQVNFRGVLKAARVDPGEGSRLVASEPRLLEVPPEKLLRRAEALQLEMFIPRFQALSMVVRQPQILLYQASTLQTNMMSLKNLLNISYDLLVVIVGKHPNLLFFSQQAMQSKLNLLSETLGLPVPRAVQMVLQEPMLLTLSVMRLEETLTELCITLRVSMGELAEAVVQEPSIVLEGGRLVESRLQQIAALLMLPPEMVASMMSRKPSIIKYDVGQWQTNLDSLTSVLGLSISVARQLVCLAPGLLALKPVLLHSVCAQLRSLISSSPELWMEQLAGAQPEQLRKMMMFRRKEMEHLQYLADTSQQASMSLFSKAIYDRRAFARRFPGFHQWQRQHVATFAAVSDEQ